jgi:hypothetical protein
MAEHESAAMWNLYAQGEGSVAVRSTVEGLIRALRDTEYPVFINEVKYLDYAKERLDGRLAANAFSHVWCKQISSAHERELRAVIQRLHFRDESSTLEEGIQAPGLEVPIDRDSLIHEVRITPRSAPWQVDLIKAVAAKYELRAQVTRSALLDRPPI